MTAALLVDGVRTPFGKFRGSLAEWSALSLGVAAVKELVRRMPELAHADGVLLGQVLQAGQPSTEPT